MNAKGTCYEKERISSNVVMKSQYHNNLEIQIFSKNVNWIIQAT